MLAAVGAVVAAVTLGIAKNPADTLQVRLVLMGCIGAALLGTNRQALCADKARHAADECNCSLQPGNC